jgi:hypothetical protein
MHATRSRVPPHGNALSPSQIHVPGSSQHDARWIGGGLSVVVDAQRAIGRTQRGQAESWNSAGVKIIDAADQRIFSSTVILLSNASTCFSTSAGD